MATLKYINNEHVSTIVVISGLAIRAGSKPNLSAIIGSVPPINLAIITVKNRLMETTMATLTDCWRKNCTFNKKCGDKG